MSIGGLAGFRIRMALARRAPEKRCKASSVVSMYSSRLARVAGPALREAMLDATSTYSMSACTWPMAAAIGIDDWPPQVIMLMLRVPVSRQAWALMAGMQNSPSLAGVMSITVLPSLSSAAQWPMWAWAEVASNTTSQIDGSAMMASMPRSEMVTPSWLARFMPTELKLRPANRVHTKCLERITLIIRSVPMFPEPMMAILSLSELVIWFHPWSCCVASLPRIIADSTVMPSIEEYAG